MMIKSGFFMFSFFLTASIFGQHQENTQLGIEIDPAPYILNGYSVSVKYSPKQTPKVAYMASVYQSDFPEGMMTKSNKNNGWKEMKIERSYAAFAEFYLNDRRKGFYVGPSVFWYNKSVAQEAINDRMKFSTIYPNIRAGYIWYPFKELDLYLNPWFNIGSEINVDKNNQLHGNEFEPNKLNYILAIHIGYKIEL